VEGSKLSSGCDPCVASICLSNPSCCTSAWDATCVGLVTSSCGLTCGSWSSACVKEVHDTCGDVCDPPKAACEHDVVFKSRPLRQRRIWCEACRRDGQRLDAVATRSECRHDFPRRAAGRERTREVLGLDSDHALIAGCARRAREAPSLVRRSAVVGLDATIAADGSTGGTHERRHIHPPAPPT
jgi:hypothetical protein